MTKSLVLLLLLFWCTSFMELCMPRWCNQYYWCVLSAIGLFGFSIVIICFVFVRFWVPFWFQHSLVHPHQARRCQQIKWYTSLPTRTKSSWAMKHAQTSQSSRANFPPSGKRKCQTVAMEWYSKKRKTWRMHLPKKVWAPSENLSVTLPSDWSEPWSITKVSPRILRVEYVQHMRTHTFCSYGRSIHAAYDRSSAQRRMGSQDTPLISKPNMHATRETHHTQSPFHQARSIPPKRKKWSLIAGTVIIVYHCTLMTAIIQPSRRGGDTDTSWSQRVYCDQRRFYTKIWWNSFGHTWPYEMYRRPCMWADNLESTFLQAVEYLDVCGRNGITLNPEKFVFAGFKITKGQRQTMPTIPERYPRIPHTSQFDRHTIVVRTPSRSLICLFECRTHCTFSSSTAT